MRKWVILLGMSVSGLFGATEVQAQHTVMASATVVEPLQAGPAPVQLQATSSGLRATFGAASGAAVSAAGTESRVLEKAVVEGNAPVRRAGRAWSVREEQASMEARRGSRAGGVTVTRYVFANS